MQKIDRIYIFFLTIFTIFFHYICAYKGFFDFDQGKVLDGGYRIFCAQRPFVDFFTPIGPVPFYLQTFFYNCFGLEFFSYYLHAAVINLLAVLMIYQISLRLSDRYIAVLASLVSSVSFYSVSGTPYYDTTSFFFALLAFYLLICPDLNGNFKLFLIGFSISLSFMSKQNVGGIHFTLFLIYLMIHIKKKKK